MRPFDGTWTDLDVATLQTAIAQAEAAFPPEGSSLQATLNEAKEVLRSATFDVEMFMKKVGSSLDQVKGGSGVGWFLKGINDSDCKVIAHLIDSGALDKLEVSWCPNALSPCPETLHVHSSDSEDLFDVPYAGAFA